MQDKIYQTTSTLSKLDPNREDSLLYLSSDKVWGLYKPHHISSSRGKQVSILDILVEHYHSHPLIQQALKLFGTTEELGMLTRLDHDTAGLLWFAHNTQDKIDRLHDQSQHLITKIYRADLIGRIHEAQTIDQAIAHHKFDDRLMLVSNVHNGHKIRGQSHQVATSIIPLSINGSVTHIQACIHQGIKHQIRVHCASIGCPILGETLYHKSKSDSYLHLWSCGINWDKNGDPIIIDHQQVTK